MRREVLCPGIFPFAADHGRQRRHHRYDAAVLSADSQLHSVGFLRLFAAQVAAAAGASTFAFFLVAALQGLLINLTTPRTFARISPWIQLLGMSLMILALLLFPMYSGLLAEAARTGSPWLWFFPPFWFTGMYDLLLPHSDPRFAALGKFGLQALAVAIAMFGLSWAVGFRRHYRRTLESEDTQAHSPRTGLLDRMPASEKLAPNTASPAESLPQHAAPPLPRHVVEYRHIDRTGRRSRAQRGHLEGLASGARAFLPHCFLPHLRFSLGVSVSGGTGCQLVVPRYRRALDGNLAPRHPPPRSGKWTVPGVASVPAL